MEGAGAGRLNMGAGRLNIIVGLAFCLKSVCILHVTDRH